MTLRSLSGITSGLTSGLTCGITTRLTSLMTSVLTSGRTSCFNWKPTSGSRYWIRVRVETGVDVGVERAEVVSLPDGPEVRVRFSPRYFQLSTEVFSSASVALLYFLPRRMSNHF